MTDTWLVASIVAVIAGVVGFFVVLRAAAFPAHAIPNTAFAGAAAANLFGFDQMLGLAGAAGAAAVGIAALSRRGRQDVGTALGLVLGLAGGAVLLSRSGDYEPQLYALLFGEVLGASSASLLAVSGLGVACLAAVVALYRPLLFGSVLPSVAEIRSVRTRRLETAFLLIVAAATTLSVPVVGSLLVFALMIGPPAAARCFTERPGPALATSVGISLITVWLAIASSYATNWPIGFYVGTLSALSFGSGRAWRLLTARRRSGSAAG